MLPTFFHRPRAFLSNTHTNLLLLSLAASSPRPSSEAAADTHNLRGAYFLLRFTFTVALLLAGTDKFCHFLVNWDQYLAPFVARLSGGNGHSLMLIAGAIEIVLGFGVALRPRIFAWLAAIWLFLIIANLLLIPRYFDVALRDLGLALAGVALARLSRTFD